MQSALWIPAWYELDQPIEVGVEDEFAFWRVVPEGAGVGGELMLFNQLFMAPYEYVFGVGVIVGIRQAGLGAIRKIDTVGLDYKFTLADGVEILVNAEEEPGRMFEGRPGAWVESTRVVADWRVEVEFRASVELTPKPTLKRRRGRKRR